MEVKNSTLLNFVQQGLEIAKAIPKYFSKFSNKIFTNRQHLVLVVLKQKLRTTWRDLISLLEVSIIPSKIKLRRIPHFTTLIRFSKKISPMLVNKLLAYSTSLSKPKKLKLGIDATGLELDKASHHYRMRQGSEIKQKDVIQITACGLMDSLLVSSARVKRYNVVRSNDLIPVVEESIKLGKVEFVAADKGYDSNKNHEYVVRKLKTKSLIKVKNRFSTRNRSTLRKRVYQTFDEKTYHQRSKIETIFSMIKRKYGSAVRGKSKETQVQEGFHKLLAHNLDRLCKIISQIIKGFHQS